MDNFLTKSQQARIIMNSIPKEEIEEIFREACKEMKETQEKMKESFRVDPKILEMPLGPRR